MILNISGNRSPRRNHIHIPILEQAEIDTCRDEEVRLFWQISLYKLKIHNLHTQTCTHVSRHIQTRIHTHPKAGAHAYRCTCIRIHVHAHTLTRKRIQACKRTDPSTYTRTSILMFLFMSGYA